MPELRFQMPKLRFQIPKLRFRYTITLLGYCIFSIILHYRSFKDVARYFVISGPSSFAKDDGFVS
jgi:hypothetical protein